MYVGVNVFALFQCLAEDFGVHIHIFLFTTGARSAVGDIDFDVFTQFVDVKTVSGIAGQRNHRLKF